MSDRIRGGCSIHDEEKPELCPHGIHDHWRVIDCCKQEEDRDVIECSRCGQQKSVRCNFDDDMA